MRRIKIYNLNQGDAYTYNNLKNGDLYIVLQHGLLTGTWVINTITKKVDRVMATTLVYKQKDWSTSFHIKE